MDTRQAITKRPYVFKHPTESGFGVVFGTGSYITEEDGTNTDLQSIYGIWDRGEVAPATLHRVRLEETENNSVEYGEEDE